MAAGGLIGAWGVQQGLLGVPFLECTSAAPSAIAELSWAAITAPIIMYIVVSIFFSIIPIYHVTPIALLLLEEMCST